MREMRKIEKAVRDEIFWLMQEQMVSLNEYLRDALIQRIKCEAGIVEAQIKRGLEGDAYIHLPCEEPKLWRKAEDYLKDALAGIRKVKKAVNDIIEDDLSIAMAKNLAVQGLTKFLDELEENGDLEKAVKEGLFDILRAYNGHEEIGCCSTDMPADTKVWALKNYIIAIKRILGWTMDETENFLKNFIEGEPEDAEERELTNANREVVEKALKVLW